MAERVGRIVDRAMRNIRDRFTSARHFVRTQVELTRRAWEDIKGRFGLEGAKEPTLPKEAGIPGVVSGTFDVIRAYAALTADNIERFVQEQADITRRWVRGE